jgi:hypothetical protein
VTEFSVAVRQIAGLPLLLSLPEAIRGSGAELRSVKGMLRGAGSPKLSLHSDIGVWWASPFPRSGLTLTVMVPCSPFTVAEGGTFVVPGSQLYLREPQPAEDRDNTETSRTFSSPRWSPSVGARDGRTGLPLSGMRLAPLSKEP